MANRRKKNPSPSHERTAKKIASKYRADYPPKSGVDIVTGDVAIEVETPGGVKQGIQQLRGHRKRSYIAGTNQQAVEEALDKTKGTTIGVMDNQGNIIKRSTRKK